MSNASIRGGDPEALVALTRLLDLLADELDRARTELRSAVGGLTVVPAVDRIAEVSAWLRSAATTSRRVTLDLLSEGRDWRAHHSIFDDVAGVASAFGHGFVGGAAGMVRGLIATVESSAANVASAGEAMWDTLHGDWDQVQQEVASVGGRERQVGDALWHSAVGLAETDPWMLALHAHQDGFWRAARDFGKGWGAQTPALLLTVATAGSAAEATGLAGASDVAGNLGNAGFFDPYAAAPGSHGMQVDEVAAVALSVPVGGDGGHRVGLDPRTGDFIVAKADGEGDVSIGEKRWSRLSDEERRAVKDSKVVDGHGHLIDA